MTVVRTSRRLGASAWTRGIALGACCVAATQASAAQSTTYTGSITVGVTDNRVVIEKIDQQRFADFAKQTLARYFKLGNKVALTSRASAKREIEDIELVGPSRCLATGVNRTGWQKLRFEFSYQVDGAYWAQTTQVRFEIQLRIVSGELADFPHEYEPPADRYKQLTPAELTDLATKLAGFMRTEMSSDCFDKGKLQYCPASQAETCQ